MEYMISLLCTLAFAVIILLQVWAARKPTLIRWLIPIAAAAFITGYLIAHLSGLSSSIFYFEAIVHCFLWAFAFGILFFISLGGFCICLMNKKKDA